MTLEREQKEIELDFLASWNRIDVFYVDLLAIESWHWLQPLVEIIDELRKRGYDRHLRAGQSMFQFIVSCSRRHHMRLDQSFLRFEPQYDGTMSIAYFGSPDSGITLELNQIALTEK
jgi:hypothetical protein